MKLYGAVTAFLASAYLSCYASADHTDAFGWAELEVRLPKAISDHTAVLAKNGMIYIAGGCDSENGNVFVPPEDPEENGSFVCFSISKSFYVFDPVKEEFATLDDLPRERYRHSSVVIGNKVWLVGGRDGMENLIPQVDVYDIDKKSWSTESLPEEVVVSDHASFADDSAIYIAGGYIANYTAQSMVTRVAVESAGSDTLTVSSAGSLATARGDIIGVTSKDGTSAYIAGGFTDDNKFCAPLESAEEYIFAEDKWQSLPNIINERGEIVLVDFADHLYALGGERQIDNICNITDQTDPGELTVGTDLVEVLEGNDWKVASSFPFHKFRFAAVAVEETGLIYAFGGQTEFDGDCGCFKTTDDVVVFGEDVSSSAFLSSSVAIVLSLTVTIAGMFM